VAIIISRRISTLKVPTNTGSCWPREKRVFVEKPVLKFTGRDILSFLSSEGFELDWDRISTFYQSLFNIESA
jgi:hypothetical protein